MSKLNNMLNSWQRLEGARSFFPCAIREIYAVCGICWICEACGIREIRGIYAICGRVKKLFQVIVGVNVAFFVSLALCFMACTLELSDSSACFMAAYADENNTSDSAGSNQDSSKDSNQDSDKDSSQDSDKDSGNTEKEQILDLDDEANSVKENQLPDSSFIYDTSISSLAHADAYYNKMTVQVVGEAVGDVIADTNLNSKYCWVSLWDANETVSVFMLNENAKLIDTLGSHHRSGTKLQVKGKFHISCEEHDGISDLHAETVSVQSRGRETQEEFSPIDFLPGVLLLAVGGAMFAVFRHLRDRNL